MLCSVCCCTILHEQPQERGHASPQWYKVLPRTSTISNEWMAKRRSFYECESCSLFLPSRFSFTFLVIFSPLVACFWCDFLTSVVTESTSYFGALKQTGFEEMRIVYEWWPHHFGFVMSSNNNKHLLFSGQKGEFSCIANAHMCDL